MCCNFQEAARDRWVYVWADGIYSGLRAEQARLCARVVIGVNEYGKKRFLVIEDGVRESTQSWREVLLKLKSRGMNIPELAVGDGAMGFWAALEEIYPETRPQRCWMHKTMNVLNGLPKYRFRQRRNCPCTPSGRPKQKQTPRRHSTCSLKPMSRSTPRRPSACRKTEKNCWLFTASRPRTGRASGRPIRLSRLLPPFATRPGDPEAA